MDIIKAKIELQKKTYGRSVRVRRPLTVDAQASLIAKLFYVKGTGKQIEYSDFDIGSTIAFQGHKIRTSCINETTFENADFDELPDVETSHGLLKTSAIAAAALIATFLVSMIANNVFITLLAVPVALAIIATYMFYVFGNSFVKSLAQKKLNKYLQLEKEQRRYMEVEIAYVKELPIKKIEKMDLKRLLSKYESVTKKA